MTNPHTNSAAIKIALRLMVQCSIVPLMILISSCSHPTPDWNLGKNYDYYLHSPFHRKPTHAEKERFLEIYHKAVRDIGEFNFQEEWGYLDDDYDPKVKPSKMILAYERAVKSRLALDEYIIRTLNLKPTHL
jgi:hypothetical protein